VQADDLTPPRAPFEEAIRDIRWLTAAGYATWFVCGIPPLAEMVGGQLRGARAVIWLTAHLLFGAAFAAMDRAERLRRGLAACLALLTLQSVAGLAGVLARSNGFTSITLVIVAAQLPRFLSARRAAAWVAVQTLVNAAIFSRLRWTDGVTAGVAVGGFQLFALASAILAAREHAARVELSTAHQELLATRALLAENSRTAERLRIARDLHDTLGHHLTALSLQLDVASRLTEGKAAAHLGEAHAMARLLLSDVRDVVGRMRDERPLDLVDAIRTLAVSSPGLEIHLTLPPSLDVDDPPRVSALLRGIQEIITNTVRHAGARHLWIALERRDGGVALRARDDGRGAARLAPGHGLSGMRERFEECAGRIEFHGGGGRGFEVDGFIPDARAAS
jgi:signal transduction histidine kinase